jgi:hypothetical protein
MKKIKSVTQVTLLGMIAVGSTLVAVSGVAYALQAILQGDRVIDIAGPVAVTILFSRLCAECILKSISKIEKLNKNGK